MKWLPGARNHLDKQDRTRDRLLETADDWARLTGAPASSWTGELRTVNRSGRRVLVTVNVTMTPLED